MNSQSYERHKRRAAARQAAASQAGREIGEVPWVANPARRRAAAADFRLYCETYHRPTFSLGWSDDHLKVIGQIETSVKFGGLFATAMPRGSGKTSLAEAACEWATLNGYHPFVCLVGSDKPAAAGMLASLMVELEANELLAADYPEVCLAIARLEGIANRCGGQTYRGERTRMQWTSKGIVLPSIRPAGWKSRRSHRSFVRDDGYSLASGAIIKVAGITGGIRGLKHKRPDGATVRPSLVVPDDPQTDASARSPSQCESRERILAGAILGLAGPGKKISGVMPCTVIRRGDVADNILDRAKHPEWHGTRTKLVYRFPADEKLWEEYGRIRAESMQAERGTAEADEFYRRNREAMDAGAVVAWPERKNPDEISAIQHAMNLLLDRGKRAFFAEYQNDPLPEEEARSDDLTPDRVAAKLNRRPRGEVPITCGRVTAFIDVQGSLLYWAACAWEDDFTGYVIDYGTFPDQRLAYFTLRDAKVTLDRYLLQLGAKAAGLEGRLYAGLERLADQILGRDWARDDGATLRAERCLIDANWGESTAVVRQFCRQSKHAAVLHPSHGRGITASGTPMADWPKRPGERAGLNWRLRPTEGSRTVRSVLYDANGWKSFLHSRLATAMGDRGCLSLFGEKAEQHRMIAEHVCSEYRVRTEGRGRQVDEWKLKPGRPDNHWLDCLSGCAVAASIQGVALAEASPATPRKRRRLTPAELIEAAKKKREGNGS